MKTFFKDFKNFALNPKFIIPLILSVALGYGYVLNHFAIGIDDLTRPRYIQGELIAQGRLSGTLISYLFGYTEYRPFWEDFVSILFIILAAFVAAIFLKRITKDRVHPHVYTFFACFLATYPIINEIFLYAGSGLNMGIGYALTFIAAILMEDFFEKKKWYTIAFCTLIFIFNISMYESFVFVYSCCVCGVLTIKQLMADEIFLQINQTKNQKSQEKLPLKKIITQILWYILPLILGFVFEYIISAGVRSFLNLETSTNAASYIVFPPKIREVITFSVYRYIFNGLWYLPITILVISGIVMLIITARNCIRCKTPVYLLYTAGMFLSVLALPILQSGEIKYRTSQSLVMFCIFPLTLLLQKCLCGKSKIKQYTTIAVSLLLILAQSVSLCKWFYVDYQQSEEELSVLRLAGEELAENYDLSKPIVFVGEYTLSDSIYDYKFASKEDMRYKALDVLFGKFAQSMSAGVPSEKYGFSIAQTNHLSVITWGIDAFKEVNTELLRIYSYLGYDNFIQGTEEQFEEALTFAEQLADGEKIPESGYIIVEQDEYIVVAFG